MRDGGLKEYGVARGPQRVLIASVLAALVLLIAWASLALTRYNGSIASVWLANAIVVAAVLRSPRDRWAELIGAALLANIVAHLSLGDDLAFSIIVSFLKIAEIVLVVIPLGRRFGDKVDLYDLRHLGFFLLLAGLVAPLFSGVGIALYFGLAQGAAIAPIVATWVVSHGLGLLTLTPLLLAIPANLDPFRAPPAVIAERLAIIVVTLTVTALVYSQSAPLQWAVMPLIVLVAFRLPACGVALTIAGVATIALVLTSSGMGPITAAELDPTGRLLILQAFVATAVLVALPISAIIGERNRLLADVTVARDEARAAAEAKSNFLATMSHEIRTPMTGVLGMIELLRSDPAVQERDRYFDTLRQSATLLMTVLDDILDFSKLESGNVVLDDIDFSLEELAQSTLNLFATAASQKGLLLSMQCDCPPQEYVRGDATRIQQVMSNLINNAIKFTERGRITILVRSTVLDPALRKIRVEIVDTGIGIAPEQVTQLFQPFVQAESSISRRFGGTGLGLAISRWLTDAMGGTIGVESEPRAGSTFWFELPLQQGLGPEWQAPPISAPKAGRSLDILVAEDNLVNQLLIEAILRKLGHRATVVENGLLAVASAEKKVFDCILMDMQMPEMDGMAATRAIRALDGLNANVPIIALTADVSAERRRFYDQAGLTDFLAKPIDRLALAARLVAIAGPSLEVETEMDVAAPRKGEVPLLDTTNINQLCAAIGSTSFDGLLDLLQVEMAERPAAIRIAVIAGDDALARQEAHSLKGACISIGAMALGQAAAMIELAPDLQAMNAALETLDRQTMRTRQAVEALIPRSIRDRNVG